MLKLTMYPDDYLVINDNIVLHLTRAAGGHADVAIDAPREISIVRGAVLERMGGQRPACLYPPMKKKPHYYRDKYFPWNDDRERAVRVMKQVIDRMDENGASEDAAILRKQLDRIIPPVWEDEIIISSSGAKESAPE